MAQQTINVGTAPNDGTGTPLRTAFQYTNSNFSELYTALGGGSGLPGTSGQVLFNNGTNIAGDAGLVYNSTTDALTIGGNVQAASATITGDLTVDTSTLKVDSANNRVGVGTASPALPFVVSNAGAQGFEINPNGSIVSGGIDILSYNRSTSLYKGAGFAAESYLFRVGTVSATDAMTLNSTGLGVGTSPAANSSLTVYRANSNSALRVTNGPSANNVGITLESLGGNVVLNNGNGPLEVSVGGSLRATIDSSGNVGIGVTPRSWLSSYKAIQLGYSTSLSSTTGTDFAGLSSNAYVDSVDSRWERIVSGYATQYYQNAGDGQHIWRIAGTAAADTAITWTNAMTLDASGNLLVGTTNTNPAYNAVDGVALSPTFLSVSNTSGVAGAFNRNSDGIVLYFTRNGTAVGNVSVTTGGTTFNSTSDYRLKESISPLVGGLARVNALKPSIYKWKSDGSSGEGFLAHELAEVVPLAVTGQKDAVKDDGSIEAQGVDLSRVVPILVAAIQELTARVQTLETR